ncbi:MAG: DNA primase [Candidatus Aenigmarchaeota archaeon]|nr:DNA primase [Candidatus Aenigmarchaeota archaeon]
MAKLAQNFAKYLIHARMHATSIVEKPDIIGAIFGQTEGLLGADLDLRELQHTGRIGRIEVNVKSNKGKAFADIIIPSSLDASETSLIAASMETIEKVGPCEAKIDIVKVEDVRSQKRRYVVERAKEILRAMMDTGMPDTQKISEMIKESVRSWEVSNFNGLSCGPDVHTSDDIIIVEGRADVINLLKNGIRNVIAIEGSKIPQAVIGLTKEKTTTAFLDGDRGGNLDLKKLLAVAEIDYVAWAEPGKEVEELTKKQIFKALRERAPVDQALNKPIEDVSEEVQEIDASEKEAFVKILEDLIGTRAACLVDRELQVISKVPLSELADILPEFTTVYAIIFDGKVNQSIVDLASRRTVEYVVGMGYRERVRSGSVKILTLEELKGENFEQLEG